MAGFIDAGGAACGRRILRSLGGCLVLLATTAAMAAGTPVGTIIQNTATVDFDIAGTPVTLQSNTTAVTVLERIDVVVALQSPQRLVAPNDSNQALLFTVTNLGNGSEAFSLAIDSVLAGDDFDPSPSATPIYFDTDGSGDFSVGDTAYTAGNNDPVLAADESIDILILNDIPGTAANGELGLSQLTVTSLTGAGPAGTEFTGTGDGGVDAIIGTSTGEVSGVGEYLVSDVAVSVVKAQVISDPFGGVEVIPGATITYTITVEVTNSGTATATVLRDPIPNFTTYVPGSIAINAVSMSDAADGDAGTFETTGAPTVVADLGDLTQADGLQTIVFRVTID